MNRSDVLKSAFEQIALRMRADFVESRATINHRGSAGTVREGILKKFLESYLPNTVEVTGSGEVISTDGSRSKQVDIIIKDPGTPPLYVGPDNAHQILPAECVYGIVEVKTNLSKHALIEACENLRSVKRLEKYAFSKDPLKRQTTRYGRTWSHTPTLGIIFAFESAELETLGTALREWCKDVPHHERPDSVWILDRGALSWSSATTPYSLDGYPSEGAFLHSILPLSDGILLPLALRLSHQFQQVFMPPFDLEQYASGAPLAEWHKLWMPPEIPVQFDGMIRIPD